MVQQFLYLKQDVRWLAGLWQRAAAPSENLLPLNFKAGFMWFNRCVAASQCLEAID
jgi:hypothetical protein